MAQCRRDAAAKGDVIAFHTHGGDWDTFLISPVTPQKQKFSISFVITVSFDGLLRTEPPFLWDSAHASIGWTERHFWQRYPPPISGPCHRRWPLCYSVNRMTSGTSCSLSAPVGCGWADWTMTCVCENLCQGWGQIWGKTKVFSMRWILKCLELSWSLITSMKEDKKKTRTTLNIYFLLIVPDQRAWQISQELKGGSVWSLLAIIVGMALSKEIKTLSTSPTRSMGRQTDEPTGRGSQIIKSHLSAPFKAFNSLPNRIFPCKYVKTGMKLAR